MKNGHAALVLSTLGFAAFSACGTSENRNIDTAASNSVATPGASSAGPKASTAPSTGGTPSTPASGGGGQQGSTPIASASGGGGTPSAVASTPKPPATGASTVVTPTPSASGPTPATSSTGMPTVPAGDAYKACSGTAVPALKLTDFIAKGLTKPIDMAIPPKKPTTIFVIENGGKVKLFEGADATPKELVDVKPGLSFEECGLLGIAVHPNYDGMTEKRIYLASTPKCGPFSGAGTAAGTDQVDEYTVDGDKATLTKTLFKVDDPGANHNGGSLAFGKDGFLYYGLGDGGGSNDDGSFGTLAHEANGNAQTPNVPLGKLLRFDVEKPDASPAGNLTKEDVGGAAVDSRVFHYGLRNPWRFSFDRETQDLWIGDVGQDKFEEINFVPKDSRALNFGWANREGKSSCTTCKNRTLLAGTKETTPIYDYATKAGSDNGSVIGGFVYRGTKIPGLYGRYLFADFGQGFIKVLAADGKGGSCDVADLGVMVGKKRIVSFAQDPAGELYVVDYQGKISRIDPK